MDITNQYLQAAAALRDAGILDRLEDAKLGMFPLPVLEQVRDLVDLNHDLVKLKTQQGFTQLQLTPLCMPVLQLVKAARSLLVELARQGGLRQAGADPGSVDMPLAVNRKDPVWMWERLKPLMDTPAVVYFPQVYRQENHGGMNKAEALNNIRYCAFPGWSVGLVEPSVMLPQPGQGVVLQGRKQLQTYCTPRDYMEILQSPPYRGETGWTLEDFLAFFIARLVQTNQVSFDRQDSSGLWLLGAYVPDLPKTPNLVLTANWSRGLGQKLYLSSHRTGNHFQQWGARSMIRLGR